MKGFERALALALAFSSLAMGPNPPPPMSHIVQDEDLTPVSEIQFQLSGSVAHQFSFRPSSVFPQSEAVLHVLSSVGVQVAVGISPSPGQPATVSFTPPVSGAYTLVIRAKSSGSAGVGDLYLSGQLNRTGLPFGGRTLSFDTVTLDERIEVVSRPSLRLPPMKAYLVSATDPMRIEYALGGGAAAGDVRFVPETNRHVSILVGSGNEHTGRVRGMRNDVAHDRDPDGDGLGAVLEHYLGTCGSLTSSGVPGVDCTTLADARDTDGDGISDGWEVLGRRDRSPYQTLPRWGADPRHKDMFIEIDFMRRTQAENTEGRVSKMPITVAREFARIFSDGYTTSPQVRIANAQSIGNPDGIPGVAVHLDIGEAPVVDTDKTIFGDWGGFNAVNAVSFVDGNGQTQWRGLAAHEAWKQQLSLARRGIFRYHLAYISGGASADEGFTASYNMFDSVVPPHETGHTLGLKHDGLVQDNFNCKPNYASIMSYAYSLSPGVGFSGTEPGIAPILNSTRLMESGAVNPDSATVLRGLKEKFGYNVDELSGHVDWNRDGVFSSTLVSAAPNTAPQSACEFTRRNASLLPPYSTSIYPPALVRFGSKLYVFYIDPSGVLHYTSSAATWNCSGGSMSSCQTAPWLPPVTLSSGRTGVDVKKARIGGVDYLIVVTLGTDGYMAEKRLRIVNGNEVWDPSRYLLVFGKAQPSLAATGRADRPLYLAFKTTSDILKTMYLNPQTDAWVELPTPAVHLTADASPGILFSPANLSMTASATERSTPRLWGLFNHRCDGPTSPNNHLEVLVYNEAAGRWDHIVSDLELGRSGLRPNGKIYSTMRIQGRPSLAWVPDSNQAQYPGRAYAVLEYRSSDTDTRNQSRLLMSVVNRDVVGGSVAYAAKWMFTDFDNQWYLTNGTSLLYEPGVDTHLKSVSALAMEGQPATLKRLELRPNTDGIFDADMRASNDWTRMRNKLCKYTSLMDLTVPPAISPAIACGEFPEE
jgi:hypothetical protein